MNINRNISQEFKQEQISAPVLESIPVVNSFTVPETYFSDLSDRIISATFIGDYKQNCFVVPDNYFEKKTIQLTHAFYNNTTEQHSFSVPENYFSHLPGIITSQAVLSELKNPDTFAVPEKYFNELSERILSNTALDKYKNSNHFAVPDNYFETLATSVLDKATKEHPLKKSAKIISISSRFYYVAAAASIFLLLTFSGLLRMQKSSDIPSARSLSKYEAADKKENSIASYLKNNIDEYTIITYLINEKENTDTEPSKNKSAESITRDDIVDYIMNSNPDMLNMINEMDI